LTGFAEALQVWRQAEAQGLAQAVVSNSDRAIVDANLREVGLTRPGQVTISRNDVRQGKPSPEGYLRAAWLLGVDPTEALVIEDSASGAAAGLAAGMKTAFVPHALGRGPAGTIPLRHMDEVLDLLGQHPPPV
jgi:HAD superfamily hydrolase (TIGR01509 family)